MAGECLPLFDTPGCLQHPRRVLTFGRRLSAAFLVLALAAGSPALCAGWMPAPEARMACCSNDGPCRMHTSDSRKDGTKRAVSQAEADRCCGASEQGDSAPSPSSAGFVVTLGVVPSPIPVMIPEPDARTPTWRAFAPIPAARIPRHLLLSVLLV